MNWLIAIWRIFTNHPQAQWSHLRNTYPGRRVRPILRFRRGEWKLRAFKIDPPSDFERQLEAVVRRSIH